MRKQALFKVFAALLPIVALLVIEIGLRIGDYGSDTRLFITDEDDPRCWVMNRDVSKKYFTISQNATIGNLETFYKKKPVGTLRFFVLGASSAIGFPYMHNGAFPRMLKYKLQFLYPKHNIEIINLSLTAINTYTLYDFSKRLIAYQPDGILIYAGHNEYYGALGVASSSYMGRNVSLNRWILAARELKCVQLVMRLVGNIRMSDPSLVDQDLTLMERMAARQMVPYDSELYRLGIQQFDRNMGDMLRLFQKSHIPVFIGTLVSNLKDQRPLCDNDSLSAEARKAYATGEERYLLDKDREALEFYVQAKDYDPLRFRAPEAFNTIIRKYGKDFERVYVVDLYKAFSSRSAHGIIGKELMLEHVHPNLTGQRIIAETFCDTIVDFFSRTRGLNPVNIELEESDYPVLLFDSIYGDMVITRLKQQWPFNEKVSELRYDKNSFEYRTAELFFYRKINWGQAMQRLNNHYILGKDISNASRVVEQMCLELPNESAFFRQAGSLSIQLNKKEKAAYYFDRAKRYD